MCILAIVFCSYSEVVKRKITVLKKIPHSRSSFTQGLLHDENALFESTGAPDARISKLFRINIGDGKAEELTAIPNTFCEGLALLNNVFYQLSWKSGIVFKYDKKTFKSIGQHSYSGEGWGLTADGSIFIMSNGSDTLYFRDNEFNIVGKVAVTLNGEPLRSLNELEFVNGNVFANVWYSDVIYEIDLASGKVLSQIDCRFLRDTCSGLTKNDVLNGIAFDKNKNHFYLTGKDWPWIFKVKIEL